MSAAALSFVLKTDEISSAMANLADEDLKNGYGSAWER